MVGPNKSTRVQCSFEATPELSRSSTCYFFSRWLFSAFVPTQTTHLYLNCKEPSVLHHLQLRFYLLRHVFSKRLHQQLNQSNTRRDHGIQGFPQQESQLLLFIGPTNSKQPQHVHASPHASPRPSPRSACACAWPWRWSHWRHRPARSHRWLHCFHRLLCVLV